MKTSSTLRIGLFGIGLDTYWPQFAGLERRHKGFLGKVANKLKRSGVQVQPDGDYTSRLALMEEAKTLPSGAVWDFYCLQQGVPVGEAWLDEVKSYEKTVFSKRA